MVRVIYMYGLARTTESIYSENMGVDT
jgi:hypothetical protein